MIDSKNTTENKKNDSLPLFKDDGSHLKEEYQKSKKPQDRYIDELEERMKAIAVERFKNYYY